MLILAVLSLFLACGHAAVASNAEALEVIISRLKQSLSRVDPNQPPFYDGENIFEPSCAKQVPYCVETEFWTRHRMTSEPFRVSIQTNRHIDSQVINRESTTEKAIKSIKSTAVALGTTKGWTITATASGTGSGLTGTVSGSYKDESTSTTTRTTSIEYDSTCPAGKVCRFETVTFQARLHGWCTQEGYYFCNFEEEICKAPDSVRYACTQYLDYYNKSCPRAQDSYCEVNVQVRGDDGELFSVVVFTEE